MRRTRSGRASTGFGTVCLLFVMSPENRESDACDCPLRPRNIGARGAKRVSVTVNNTLYAA